MTDDLAIAVEGWPDNELLATANAHLGLGADAGLPDGLRFLVGVVRVINRRRVELSRGLEPDEGRETTPAIFFFSPAPPAMLADPLLTIPMLDNGRTELGGNFWFVGQVAARGYRLPLDSWPDDERVFEYAINDLQIGRLPAILFENRTGTQQLRHYPSGLSEPDEVSVVSLGGEAIDMARILEVIDQAHRKHLVTPHGSEIGQLWKSGRKYQPKKDIESRIQFILRVALQSAFPAAIVREEQPQISGRLDLEIEESHGMGAITRHALLELKVLRSFTSTGTVVGDTANQRAVRDGVLQAASYREERDSIASALCCFDMRVAYTKEACFKPVRRLAKRRQVHLRVWHIFASAKDYRAAQP